MNSVATPAPSYSPLAPTRPYSRRAVLLGGGALAAGLVVAGPATSAAAQAAPLPVNPFTLGVASGDPTPDGMVLWTRLATDPVAEDGLGGMPDATVDVQWELATDEKFARVVRRGTEQAVRQFAHSVHVEVSGLQPGREYFYRFRAGGHVSRTGRTRTTPAATGTSPLSIAVTSCAQWEHGYFTAYRRAAEDQPHLILQLGDYIYEHGPGGYPVKTRARTMVGGEIFTLADYRRRHAFYRTDPDLQFAHATAPWLVVFDDHEVDNNWAGNQHEVFGVTADFLRRREAAFRAYWENMPLRLSALPRGGSMELFRTIRWGRTANLHMLDTRQYRSDQACGGLYGPCSTAKAPDRTMLGEYQEDWLGRQLQSSTATWDVLGQQVMFAQYDLTRGPAFTSNADAWDGYTAAKTRMLDTWQRAEVRNPVVLTGDVHEAFAWDLQRTTEEGLQAVGTEFVTTSITSGGDGEAGDFTADTENPGMRHHSGSRGWFNARFSTDELTVDFRGLDRVSSPGAPARTEASFRVIDGQPRIETLA